MPRTRSTGAAHFERGKPFASSQYPGAAPTNVICTPATIVNTAPIGTKVGTLSATDADTGDQFVYAITGGTHQAMFAIVSNRPAWDLYTATALGSAGSRSINVKVTDMYGKSFTKTPLTITVT